MVRILVCFKITFDLEYITPGELLALKEGRLDLSVFQRIIGGYDEAALENALRLAEAARARGEAVLTHGLTLDSGVHQAAKNLYALGFDELVCLSREEDLDWSPDETAACLGRFISERPPYDLILMGKQAGPGESAQVPRILAFRLGLPCLGEVSTLEWCEKGIRIVAKTDRGKRSCTVTRPAVYALGEADHPYLRVATLREKIAAASKEVQIRDPGKPSGSRDAPRHLGYIYEIQEKQCRFIAGKNTEEKTGILWREYLGGGETQ
jgi:electron transfer flavoprotein beta subunit